MPNKTFQTNDAVEEQGSDFNYREILDAVIGIGLPYPLSVVFSLPFCI